MDEFAKMVSGELQVHGLTPRRLAFRLAGLPQLSGGAAFLVQKAHELAEKALEHERGVGPGVECSCHLNLGGLDRERSVRHGDVREFLGALGIPLVA